MTKMVPCQWMMSSKFERDSKACCSEEGSCGEAVVVPLDPLVAAVEEKLLEEGKSIGGQSKATCAGKKLISSTIKVILAEKAGERLGGENSENLNSEAIVMGKTGDDADVFDRINELILEKQQRAKEDDQGEEATVEDGSDGDGEEDDAVRKKSADFSWYEG